MNNNNNIEGKHQKNLNSNSSKKQKKGAENHKSYLNNSNHINDELHSASFLSYFSLLKNIIIF